jgi:uncharacterized membrane protein YphA (DoxX/SURF4 family)
LTELEEHCLRSRRCALRLGRSSSYPDFISSRIRKDIRTFVETLRVLGIPYIGILQWFVPGVEFLGGLGVAVGFLTPLAALGLLVICSVALLTNSPTVVASYKPIDPADRVDDWLYQPEVMYALMLLYFITAGAGPVSVDQLLKLWIG